MCIFLIYWFIYACLIDLFCISLDTVLCYVHTNKITDKEMFETWDKVGVKFKTGAISRNIVENMTDTIRLWHAWIFVAVITDTLLLPRNNTSTSVFILQLVLTPQTYHSKHHKMLFTISAWPGSNPIMVLSDPWWSEHQSTMREHIPYSLSVFHQLLTLIRYYTPPILVDSLIILCSNKWCLYHAGSPATGSAFKILSLLTKMNKKDDLNWWLPAELLMLQALKTNRYWLLGWCWRINILLWTSIQTLVHWGQVMEYTSGQELTYTWWNL